MVEPVSKDVDAEEVVVLCEIALPALRKFARNCPDCEGSGEVIHHDDTSEECETCMTIRELIDYLTPEPPKAEPVPVTTAEAEDDDLPF